MTLLAGDLWTLVPAARDLLRAPRVPGDVVPWETTLEDPDRGRVRLTGDLRPAPGAEELVLVVHGLAGTPRSGYCLRAAGWARRLGLASLALALRGADRRGEDFYNVALTADLDAALASPELAGYRAIHLLGYSMGGYVCLHWAARPTDERVGRVAAICTPIDLGAAQRHIDRARSWLYRRHVLRGLVSIYAAAAERGRAPTPLEEVRRVRSMYDWDRLAIAPRYGYEGPEHYYEALGLARHLPALARPARLVACERDPIVPPETVRPYLGDGARLRVDWIDAGGHLAFPRGLDLGAPGPRGLEPQVLAWLREGSAR